MRRAAFASRWKFQLAQARRRRRHQRGVGVQDRLVALIGNHAEHLALGGRRVGDHRQRLIGVGRDHDLIEVLGFTALGLDRDAVAEALDSPHRGAHPDPAFEPLDEPLDVAARTARDRPPSGPAGELELTVVGEELGQKAERKVPDRSGAGGPHGGDLGGDRPLAEPSRVAGIAQELPDRGGVGPAGQRPDVAVEAQLIADQAPERRSQQIRALGEQPPPRVGELEPPVAGADRHPHLGRLGVDPELVEQRGEARVVAVVVDDEAGVDPDLAARVRDADRVRVAADSRLGLEHGQLVPGVE